MTLMVLYSFSELCYTEKNHVHNLKVMNRIFFQPIKQQQLLPPDLINMLFSNLEEMLKIHEGFSIALNTRKDGDLFPDIGPVLSEMVGFFVIDKK